MINKFKKIIAVFSSAAMMFTTSTFLPYSNFNLVGEITASAEETEPQETYVASVNLNGEESFYTTLEEAFTAAKGETATITLLNDVTTSNIILYVNSGDIIFNGGEYKLTIKGIEIEESSKLTINSGIINLKSEGVVVRKGGELVVIDGTLNGEDYAIFIGTGGNATLSGGTFSNKSNSEFVAINNSNGKVGELLLNYNSTNAEDTHYAYYYNGVPFIDSFNKTGLPAGGIYTVQECNHDVSVCEYQHIDGTETHALTCLACGYTGNADCIYGEYDHDETNHWLTCEFCKYKKAAEAHNIIAVNKKEPTCTENGNIAYWKCDDCGTCFSDEKVENEIELSDTVISKINHSFTNYVSDENATCTKDGTKTAKCNNCDETNTITDEKSATGHKFINYVTNDDATCTKNGTKTAACENEGCEVTDTQEDKAKGHSLTMVDAKEATQEKEGNIAYWECSECGKYFRDAEGKEEITALSNIMIPKVTTAATTSTTTTTTTMTTTTTKASTTTTTSTTNATTVTTTSTTVATTTTTTSTTEVTTTITTSTTKSTTAATNLTTPATTTTITSMTEATPITTNLTTEATTATTSSTTETTTITTNPTTEATTAATNPTTEVTPITTNLTTEATTTITTSTTEATTAATNPTTQATTATTTSTTKATTVTQTTTVTTNPTTEATTVATTTSATTTQYASVEDYCSWSVNDYYEKTGVKAANSKAVENKDGTVSIILTDDSGTILETYVIDPITGNGSDSEGENVDLPQTGNNGLSPVVLSIASLGLITLGIAFVFTSRKRRED